MYDRDTNQLKSEISRSRESLAVMENKYSIAQKQIEEHIKTATKLVERSNYNVYRYESLHNNQLIE